MDSYNKEDIHLNSIDPLSLSNGSQKSKFFSNTYLIIGIVVLVLIVTTVAIYSYRYPRSDVATTGGTLHEKVLEKTDVNELENMLNKRQTQPNPQRLRVLKMYSILGNTPTSIDHLDTTNKTMLALAITKYHKIRSDPSHVFTPLDEQSMICACNILTPVHAPAPPHVETSEIVEDTQEDSANDEEAPPPKPKPKAKAKAGPRAKKQAVVIPVDIED